MQIRIGITLAILLSLTSCSFGDDFNKSLITFEKVCAKWKGLDISTLKPSTVERLIVESNPLLNEGIAIGDGASSLGTRWQKDFNALQQIFVDEEILLDEALRYKSKGDLLADSLAKRTFEIRQETIDIQLKTAEEGLARYCEYVKQELRRAGRK